MASRCKNCGVADKRLDRRSIAADLREALRKVEPNREARTDSNGLGYAYALGALMGAVDVAIYHLEGLCFGCGHDREREAKEPSHA